MAFPYNLLLVLVIVCAGKYKFRGNEHQWLLWSSTERSRIGMLIIILLNLAKQFDIYAKPLLTVDIVKFNGATSRRLLCKSTNHTRPGGFIYLYLHKCLNQKNTTYDTSPIHALSTIHVKWDCHVYVLIMISGTTELLSTSSG